MSVDVKTRLPFGANDDLDDKVKRFHKEHESFLEKRGIKRFIFHGKTEYQGRGMDMSVAHMPLPKALAELTIVQMKFLQELWLAFPGSQSEKNEACLEYLAMVRKTCDDVAENIINGQFHEQNQE